MTINRMGGAFVVSSGKNMGVFKGVGYPEDVADFFRIEDYEAYVWTAHNRFPTNTPGWWGGAHPFTILDKAVVHNGEITSYGTNVRWLEMYAIRCFRPTPSDQLYYTSLHKGPSLSTDASYAMAPSLWEEIERERTGRKGPSGRYTVRPW